VAVDFMTGQRRKSGKDGKSDLPSRELTKLTNQWQWRHRISRPVPCDASETARIAIADRSVSVLFSLFRLTFLCAG
jgi:hypothetical protein